MHAPLLPFLIDERSRRLAAALCGDAAALAWAAGQCGLDASPATARLGPALYLRARARGVDGPAVVEWRGSLGVFTAGRMALQEALGSVATVLGDAGIPWAPIKGMDTGARVYDVPEERPTGDLDVLVPGEHFDGARAALRAHGWRDRHASPAAEAFLAEEGYNWQAVNRQGTLLELHFRLWGIMPERSAAEVLARAVSAPEVGATARRISAADALVLAAVHASSQPAPRPLLYNWEIHLLVGASTDDQGQVSSIVEGWGMQLPVGLAVAATAALFPSDESAGLAAQLLGSLRVSERLVARRCGRRGADAASLGDIYLARLLAGRPSRSGWHAVVRRAWPHTGVVEMQAPASWPWSVRRAWLTLSNLHAGPAADALRRWAERRHGAPS